jgi:hypothetical protein
MSLLHALTPLPHIHAPTHAQVYRGDLSELALIFDLVYPSNTSLSSIIDRDSLDDYISVHFGYAGGYRWRDQDDVSAFGNTSVSVCLPYPFTDCIKRGPGPNCQGTYSNSYSGACPAGAESLKG